MLTDCPRHTPTPLYALPALAERLGLGEIRVKDESQRFGFGAFKALGGVIAVYNVLSGAVGEAYQASATFADVMNGEHREITVDVHLRHRELGQSRPLGRRRRQAVRQSLRRSSCRSSPRPRRKRRSARAAPR